MPRIERVLFDLDDTLLPCGKVYHDAKQKFAEYIELFIGCSKEYALDIFNMVETECLKRDDAFMRTRFPLSMVETAVRLYNNPSFAHHPDLTLTDLIHEVYHTGKSVFDHRYEVYPYVYNVLEKIQDMNPEVFVYVYTKGDSGVQHKKIEDNGLGKFVDGTFVTPKKTPRHLADFLQKNDWNPSSTLVVGDSLRDDMFPAYVTGCIPVWIKNDDKPLWSYDSDTERYTNLPEVVFSSVVNIPEWIASQNAR